MNRLYIIGNGFDMHHGLRTSYYDFKKYLYTNKNELHDTLEKFVSYPTSDEDLWAKFEQNLANLDIDEILSDNSDFLPNISSDDFKDRDWHTFADILSQICEMLTDGLLDCFREFILQLDYPESIFQKKIELDINSYFLNFNYTDTLEMLYKVSPKNITYIHNCAKSNCDHIILGHGIDPKEFEQQLPEPPSELDENELQEWYEENRPYDYSYDSGKDEIMKYFSKMYKPTQQIISENKTLFESFSNIESIYIFGHSMSDVDIDYFQEINRVIPFNTKWIVSYHSNSSINSYIEVFNKLGIDSMNIHFIKLEDIQENNKQIKINFK